MHTLIAEWRLWLAAAGKSRATITLRTNQLYRFAEQHQPKPIDATAGQMIAWIATPGWAPDTRKSHRAALVSFFGWAHAFGHITVDESRKLPPIRVPAGVARPAPESAVTRALLASELREWIMIKLAAHHGLRRGEIARIHSDHLLEDLSGWSLRVHGKGGKIRVIPLDDETATALRTLPDGWAFPSPRGGHLTEGHVGVLISRALPGKWTAHPLRHRFATTAYAGTRDLLAVQELLGHSRPDTTRGYIQLPQDALRAAVSAASVRTLPRVPASDEVEEAA